MRELPYRLKDGIAIRIVFAFLFLILPLINLLAQNQENINIGKKETIYSETLKENRKLWIYTPGNTSYAQLPGKKYPVLYLLDGDAHFYSTVGIVQQLSQANGNGVLPEMIIVGIENTNRLRDLVPSGDKEKINPFVKFLSSELLPYIEKNYGAAPYRVLAGHSLGGLTAIDILTEMPKTFNAYIAIDPSMWYEKEGFLKNTVAKLPVQNMKGIRIYIAAANTMPAGMTIPKMKKDKSAETEHIRAIFKLDDFLKKNKNGLKYGMKYYENDNHNSVLLIAGYDALRFIFDYYHLNATEKDFTDSTEVFAVRLKKHYARISEELGYRNSAPEELIKFLGYDALAKKHFKKAEVLFKLNIEGYPESGKAYESYADYLAAVKDTANALVNYKKALQIKDDPAVKNKLNALTGEKGFTLSLKEMEKYTGVYVLTAFNLDMKIVIRDNKLWAVVPGQADSEFIPISKNVFTVNGKQGYKITFDMNNDEPLGFTSIQPNGTFKAAFKNKLK